MGTVGPSSRPVPRVVIGELGVVALTDALGDREPSRGEQVGV